MFFVFSHHCTLGLAATASTGGGNSPLGEETEKTHSALNYGKVKQLGSYFGKLT